MTILQIRIQSDGPGLMIEVDRLLREDANERECAAVDRLHDTLRAMFEASPSRRGPIVDVKP